MALWEVPYLSALASKLGRSSFKKKKILKKVEKELKQQETQILNNHKNAEAETFPKEIKLDVYRQREELSRRWGEYRVSEGEKSVFNIVSIINITELKNHI